MKTPLFGNQESEGLDRINKGPGCLICGSERESVFFKLLGVPVLEGVLCRTLEKALDSPLGDIILTSCDCCGYIRNQAFEPTKIDYSQNYDVTLHHSPLYQVFTRNLAARLVDQFDLRKKLVLEIGCGKGEFLRALCEHGRNNGVGFDPTFAPTRSSDESQSPTTFIRDFYSEKYASYVGDFVCCRHVLEVLPDPKEFVTMVRRAIGDRFETLVYFEVPNSEYTFRDLVIWNIVYQNHSYFSPDTLARLFNLSGFEVLGVTRCFEDGQYVGIEATPGRQPSNGDVSPDLSLGGMPEVLAAFASNFERRLALWRERIKVLDQKRIRVVAWGAGARAISFFNTLKIKSQIPYIVDINPKRQGLFLPGTGQKVVGPDFLMDYQPDTILITNPTFEPEIRQQANSLGIACNFLNL
jgi:SAM-dependent methyltransferase